MPESNAEKTAAWEFVIDQYDIQLAALDPVEDADYITAIEADKVTVQAKIDAL